MRSERQKPFNKVGYLNAEIITRKHYHDAQHDSKERCDCLYCRRERNKRRREVNWLMGRNFYKGV